MIRNNEDLLNMLDELFDKNRKQDEFWDQLYEDRTREIPIFTDQPDETLVELISHNDINTAFDIGSGNGRNAVYIAKQGITTSVMDFAQEPLNWVKDYAEKENVTIDINKGDVTKDNLGKKFDLIYDSGCFHHLTPHRREDYKNFIISHMEDDGLFGLVTFYAGGSLGGYDGTDQSCYEDYTIHGGLGYTEEKIEAIFYEFEIIDQRRMKSSVENQFGEKDLLYTLMRKRK